MQPAARAGAIFHGDSMKGVFHVLAEAGSADASEVTEQADILAPSLTRMITSMAERGLIARARDKATGGG